MKPIVRILYATVTGNAECCAIDLARLLEGQGISSVLENLATYPATALSSESIVLFVVSTWGDGEPPDDALPFLEDLNQLPPAALANVRFGVFALGDASYEIFCGFGKNCDQAMEAAGGSRLVPCEECDLDQDEKLPGWAHRVAATLTSQHTPPSEETGALQPSHRSSNR